MRVILQEIATGQTPEALAARLERGRGAILLRTGLFNSPGDRFSFVAARPFLTFRSRGSMCELESGGSARTLYGNPWELLESLLDRCEVLEQADVPFPLGGCFGYWGWDLKNFVEPGLPRCAPNDLELPDCCAGFYGSLVVFDHSLDRCWIVATGMAADGSRSDARARRERDFWKALLEGGAGPEPGRPDSPGGSPPPHARVESNLSRDDFIARVRRAQEYIRNGDIYQVNLSHRLSAPVSGSGLDLYLRLAAVSPAPFSAWMDCGAFEIVSSSPEQFLRMSGPGIRTRPIKGTRPRSNDPVRDAQLAYELQTSAKELAELVMITDLLRNDLGKICEFGSVQTPEIARLERYPHVQHLVSTVEGRLRPGMSHLGALASSFPGGSVTGAPKIRAIEIIDELEPVSRGPYTGALGYLGFNRESQLSIIIRAALRLDGAAYFQTGAGIVADSDPAAEYDETMAKARGFLEALRLDAPRPALHPATAHSPL